MDRASARYKQHVAAALEKEPGPLYDWMREVYRRDHDVLLYILQEDIAPMHLEMFEGYWIGQFSDLLNIVGVHAGTQDSEVGKQIKAHLRAQIELARRKPEV